MTHTVRAHDGDGTQRSSPVVSVSVTSLLETLQRSSTQKSWSTINSTNISERVSQLNHTTHHESYVENTTFSCELAQM
jgi:hypothetical protein